MLAESLRRKTLASGIAHDEYLDSVAEQAPSHRFLGGATQGCYLRMIRLLLDYYAAQGRRPEEVAVLDWGAGKGHISYLLAKAGFRITSCDVLSESDDSTFHQETPIVNRNALEIVPLRHPFKLPFDDSAFDLVVSFGVLEHVPHENDSLLEIHRILKTHGTFFFCFLPYWLSWTQRIAHLRGNSYHDRLYSKRGLRKMLTATGFRLHGVWHGQLFPKNSMPNSDGFERVDRFLTEHSPLKFLATNLEGFAIKTALIAAMTPPASKASNE